MTVNIRLFMVLSYLYMAAGLLQFTSIYAQLIITELYRDPPGAESDLDGGASHEFIELVNIGNIPVPVAGLCFTNGTEADSCIPVYDTLPLATGCRYSAGSILPGEICCIIDSDYCALSQQYGQRLFTFPEKTVLLTCTDGEFGRSGLTAESGLVFYRGTRRYIDSIVCYAADVPPLLSTPTAEKVLLSYPKNSEGVSISCRMLFDTIMTYEYTADSLNPGTVPAVNNEWVMEYDCIDGTIGTHHPNCTLLVRYLGDQGTCPPMIQWRIVRSVHGVTETITGADMSLFQRMGTAVVQVPVDSVPLRWIVENKQQTSSRAIDLALFQGFAGMVRVSEFFPRATVSEPEWIELFNTSAVAVNVKGWQLVSSEDTATICVSDCFIQPQAFFLLTRNEALLRSRYPWIKTVRQPRNWNSIHNTRDTVMIIDGRDNTVETICFDATVFDEWPSVSLQRADSGCGCERESWFVAQRSTPGMALLHAPMSIDSKPVLVVGPVPFTPDNDHHDDLLSISLSLPSCAVAEIMVYGFDGNLLTKFTRRVTGTWYWDGTSRGKPAPPGPFFVCANIRSDENNVIIRKKGILWRK